MNTAMKKNIIDELDEPLNDSTMVSRKKKGNKNRLKRKLVRAKRRRKLNQ